MTIALNNAEYKLDAIFQALANGTRRALLAKLRQGPAMVTELAKPFDLSLNAISKHLRVLEKAGLINRAISGRVHTCSLGATPLAEAGNWLLTYQEFWNANLHNFAAFVESGEDIKEK